MVGQHFDIFVGFIKSEFALSYGNGKHISLERPSLCEQVFFGCIFG